jgi:prophage DNA circulation protein
MSWDQTFQEASFRGHRFEVFTVSNRETKAVTSHERPYTDGAEVEDQGLRGEVIEVRALLRGDDYELRLDGLRQALRVRGPGELVHPIHGSVQAVAHEWDHSHEADSRDSATLSIKFLVHRLSPALFTAPAPIVVPDRVEAAGAEAVAQSTESVTEQVEEVADTPNPRSLGVTAAFNQVKSQLRKLVDLTSVKVVLADLEPLIYPRAALADLKAIVDGAFQGLPFGGLNGLFGGSKDAVSMTGAMADYNRLTQGLDATITVQPQSSDGRDAGIAAAMTAHARILAAVAAAKAAAMILAAELEELQLDVADLQRLVSSSRAAIQSAMDAARLGLDAERRALAVAALANMAEQVQEAGRAAIELRPPVVSKPAPVGGHARLVAHALYGDHNRAAEIERLNSLGRRLLIEPGEVLRVYAR